MNYLRKFNEHSDYLPNKVNMSCRSGSVAYCDSEYELHYSNETEKKIQANRLDILYSDSSGSLLVSPNILAASEGYTPIGLCVAGTGFFGKNEPARFMSLRYMNCETPDTGSRDPDYIGLGGFRVSQAGFEPIPYMLYAYSGGPLYYYGYYTTPFVGMNNLDNYLWDYTYTTMEEDPEDPWGSNIEVTHTRPATIPSLFDSNENWNILALGSINVYITTSINGKYNTNKILNEITYQPGWRTDTYIDNNSTRVKSSPAACCCWRYHTLGTKQGDWYLPAGGELAIIAVQKTEINEKLADIAEIYTDCNPNLSGWEYWMSNLFDNDNGWVLNFSNGKITYIYRDYSRYVIAMLSI